MDGRTVYKELSLRVALQRRINRFVYCCIVSHAGEDDVGFRDSIFNGRGNGRLSGWQRLAQIRRSLFSAVEDYKGFVELAFFNEVLAHSLQ